MNWQLVLLASLVTADAPAAPKPLHPAVALLDAAGQPVVRSGGPVSTARTCGTCHDTGYIAAHSYHSSAGADRPYEPGEAPSGRPWDIGAGLFGRWDALGHGPAGPVVDLKTWLATTGARHVGGGPAEALGVEMDCFLCHMPKPDLGARNRELREGRYRWAATATLSSTGVAIRTDRGWAWDPKAFDPEGRLTDAFPRPRPSTAANCGLCHGTVHEGTAPFAQTPGRGGWSTETKGQVFSAQRLRDSGLNLAGKDSLTRPFDVHAERLLGCADCHTTANNPAQFAAVAKAAPRHLTFEPRRLSPGEYLARPDHNFAKGHAAQGTVARALEGSMRRCEQCHDAGPTHAWLPYPARHFQALNCEACHVPRVYVPAREQTDWTLVAPDGSAQVAYRGAEGDPASVSTLLHGFQPALLPREELDGSTRLTPHNLATTWYWVAGERRRRSPWKSSGPPPFRSTTSTRTSSGPSTPTTTAASARPSRGSTRRRKPTPCGAGSRRSASRTRGSGARSSRTACTTGSPPAPGRSANATSATPRPRVSRPPSSWQATCPAG